MDEPGGADLEGKLFMVTRFQGESAWDAVVNHHALDIEEEGRFKEYLAGKGVDAAAASPQVLEGHFTDWEMFERDLETLESEFGGRRILLKHVGGKTDAYVYEGERLLNSFLGYEGFVRAEAAALAWIREQDGE